jgi:hypothetical protein
VGQLEDLQARHGARFEPARLLVELAGQDRSFYDASRT